MKKIISIILAIITILGCFVLCSCQKKTTSWTLMDNNYHFVFLHKYYTDDTYIDDRSNDSHWEGTIFWDITYDDSYNPINVQNIYTIEFVKTFKVKAIGWSVVLDKEMSWNSTYALLRITTFDGDVYYDDVPAEGDISNLNNYEWAIKFFKENNIDLK